LQIMFSPATNALGRPEIFARTNALGALILATCFLIGIHWGVAGLAYAWLAGTPIFMLTTARLSLPVMGTDWGKILRALAPNILAAGAMAALVAGVHNVARAWAYPAQLGLLGGIGVLSYGALLYTFARDELGELVVLVTRRHLPKR
ncbi:MAG: polysaccharide biosynthesis C-terminal domain-containing protein, partial [Alphaproteobacteria bacterium]|nr:polysaccharide biosynthesis C-terminal domain-containing protein [Alphaproteobacteria bacterium]